MPELLERHNAFRKSFAHATARRCRLLGMRNSTQIGSYNNTWQRKVVSQTFVPRRRTPKRIHTVTVTLNDLDETIKAAIGMLANVDYSCGFWCGRRSGYLTTMCPTLCWFYIAARIQFNMFEHEGGNNDTRTIHNEIQKKYYPPRMYNHGLVIC